MTITRIGAAVGVTNANLSEITILAGDLIILFAYRDGSNTPSGLPSGYTNIANSGANTNAARICWKLAVGGETVTPTFSAATSTIAVIYRATGTIGIGASVLTGFNSGTITYPALTFTGTPGNSWVLAFAGHRNVNTNLQNAPAGMTNFLNFVDAADEVSAHDTNGPVESWSATAVALGGTSAGTRVATIEITEIPPAPPPSGGSNPTSIMGANAVSWGDVDLGGMFQDTAGTVPAVVGDNFAYLPDQAGGAAYLQTVSASEPILRDGYIEFRGDILEKAVSISGGVWFGVRFRRAGLPSANTMSIMGLDAGTGGDAWFDSANVHYTFRAGTNDFYTFSGVGAFAGGDSPGSVIPDMTFTNVHAFATATERGHYVNGVVGDRLNTSDGAPTVTRAMIGGMYGSGDDFKGPYDIVRFYILNAEPDSTQLTALNDWLENGDVGGEPDPVELTAPSLRAVSKITSPALSQNHNLTSPSLKADVKLTAPDLAQIHTLTAPNLRAVSRMAVPALQQTHTLTGQGLRAPVTLSAPDLSQNHMLAAQGLQAAATVTVPALQQTHTLTGRGLQAASTLSAPGLSQNHMLAAQGLRAVSRVTVPSLSINVILQALSLRAVAKLTVPDLSQTHNLTAENLKAVSTLSRPSLITFFPPIDPRRVATVAAYVKTATVTRMNNVATVPAMNATASVAGITKIATVSRMNNIARVPAITTIARG